MKDYITFSQTRTEFIERKLKEFEKGGGKVKWSVKGDEVEVSFPTKDDYERFTKGITK